VLDAQASGPEASEPSALVQSHMPSAAQAVERGGGSCADSGAAQFQPNNADSGQEQPDIESAAVPSHAPGLPLKHRPLRVRDLWDDERENSSKVEGPSVMVSPTRSQKIKTGDGLSGSYLFTQPSMLPVKVRYRSRHVL
jgi:hypothetical protein